MNCKWFGSNGLGINIDELKTKYRELCKKHHPDLGGNITTMQEINMEYEYCLQFARSKKNEPLTSNEIKIEKEIMDVVQRLIILKGLTIEVCGRWVWVTGDTWGWKKTLKSLNLVWASGKKAWYWRPVTAGSYHARGRLPLEGIRSKYGSVEFETVGINSLN